MPDTVWLLPLFPLSVVVLWLVLHIRHRAGLRSTWHSGQCTIDGPGRLPACARSDRKYGVCDTCPIPNGSLQTKDSP